MNGLAFEPRYAILLGEHVEPYHYRAIRKTRHDVGVYIRGVQHSVRDEPVALYRAQSGRVWYKYGDVHRDDDKPANIILAVNCCCVLWYRRGELHRDNKPCMMWPTLGDMRWNDRPDTHCRGRYVHATTYEP